MLATHALLTAVLLLPAPVSQDHPDLFSCMEPSRLAVGTFTYEYELSGRSTQATIAISRLRNANGEMFRLSYRPIPTIEAVTDFNATLSPVLGRMIGSGEERRRWERVGNDVRSSGTTGGD